MKYRVLYCLIIAALSIISCASQKLDHVNEVQEKEYVKDYYALNRFESCDDYLAFIKSLIITDDSVIEIDSSKESRVNISIIGNLIGFSKEGIRSICSKNLIPQLKLLFSKDCIDSAPYRFLDVIVPQDIVKKISGLIARSNYVSILINFEGLVSSLFSKNNKVTFHPVHISITHEICKEELMLLPYYSSFNPNSCKNLIQVFNALFEYDTEENIISNDSLIIKTNFIGQTVKDLQLLKTIQLFINIDCITGLKFNEIIQADKSSNNMRTLMDVIKHNKISRIKFLINSEISLILQLDNNIVKQAYFSS